MKKIHLLSILILLGIIWQAVRFWPDGKVHIFFCDVGQGDAAYVRFPSGQDMLIDGGPDTKVLDCLSNAMPFYDRTIDVVMMTHPQADHINGLIGVLERMKVGYFISPPVGNTTMGYKHLLALIEEKHIPVKNLYTGSEIRFGEGVVTILWPEENWTHDHEDYSPCVMHDTLCVMSSQQAGPLTQLTSMAQPGVVLGAATKEDLNHFSVIAHLSYKSFDALFTGDSDRLVEQNLLLDQIAVASADNPIEILKVPHHGSRTGMLPEFIDGLHTSLAVVSVGAKNRYGHPTREALTLLQDRGIRVLRTDQDGTVEVVSDGKTWGVKSKYSKLLK